MSYYIDPKTPSILRSTENNVLRKAGKIERELIAERDALKAECSKLAKELNALVQRAAHMGRHR